jgi:hypothetical protein
MRERVNKGERAGFGREGRNALTTFTSTSRE